MEPMTKELVAIAASVAARCQPCLEHHLRKARELGAAESDIKEAISLADRIGQVGGQRMLEYVDGRLEVGK
jgi:AhpD family alkylhydroperoxidase